MRHDQDLVLVVDDEVLLTSLLCEILEGEGYRVLEAFDGNQALKIIDEHRAEVKLVLCDISMPERDGLGVLRMCLKTYGEIPMVMVTAHDDSERVTEALRLGALDYVVKPFSRKTLKDQLPVWIEIGKRRAQNADPKKMEGLLRLRSSKLTKIG